jgi:hypothetical protein
MIHEDLSQQLIALKGVLTSALEVSLTLREFVALSRPLENKADIIDIILDDIETAVEHTPAHWFSKSPNLRHWHNSREYLVLLCDNVVLHASCSVEDLVGYRERPPRDPQLSEEMLQSELDRTRGQSKEKK